MLFSFLIGILIKAPISKVGPRLFKLAYFWRVYSSRCFLSGFLYISPMSLSIVGKYCWGSPSLPSLSIDWIFIVVIRLFRWRSASGFRMNIRWSKGVSVAGASV